MAASVKSRRAYGPSFVFLAKARSWDALKSPRNDTGIAMTNLHRSPPMNQSKTDLGIVNESQLLRFGMSRSRAATCEISGSYPKIGKRRAVGCLHYAGLSLSTRVASRGITSTVLTPYFLGESKKWSFL